MPSMFACKEVIEPVDTDDLYWDYRFESRYWENLKI